MAFSDSVRLAVGTLTVVPTGAPRLVNQRVAGIAMVIAPLAVLPIAVVASGLGWLGQLIGWPSLLCALLVVAVLTLGTRALHLDGLADTIDGLGSGWDRDRALAVMRRGDVGPMGVSALILVLGGQVVAVGAILDGWRGFVQLTILICCSRAALSLVCRRGVSAARAEGLGAGVAGSVPGLAVVGTWALVAAILMLVFSWRGQLWWLGLVAALVAVFAVSLLVRHCVRRFGGVTGDVMGAAVEVAFTSLVVMAAR